MTSAQSMLRRHAPATRRARRMSMMGMCAATLACGIVVLAASCAPKPKHPVGTPNGLIKAPYPAGIVVAVAPLHNESGVSIVDELEVSDQLVNMLEQVDGISALPINRTLGAMRATSTGIINSQQSALLIAQELGADAIIVGTITAWDPYDPPSIGLTLAMYGRSSLLGGGPLFGMEPRDLQMSSTDQLPGVIWSSGPGPLSTASRYLDASGNDVRKLVKTYAITQANSDSAIGWHRHMASMDLYTKFACHELVNELLHAEHSRLHVPVAGVKEDQHR